MIRDVEPAFNFGDGKVASSPCHGSTSGLLAKMFGLGKLKDLSIRSKVQLEVA